MTEPIAELQEHRARLELFRSMLAHGEALRATAAQDGNWDRTVDMPTGSTRMVAGQIEFTFAHDNATYRMDQLPGLISALEDALERDRLLALDELAALERDLPSGDREA